MWSYQRNPHWGWEDYAANNLVGLIILGCIIAAAVAVTVAVVLFREISRIYLAHAVNESRTAVILWSNLGALCVALLVAVVLGHDPGTASAGWAVAVFAWCAFLLIAEGCDLYEGSRGGGKDLGDLDSYVDLGPTLDPLTGSANARISPERTPAATFSK